LRILLDTTYLLPIIGIAVKELPENAILKVMKKGNYVVISHISLFELAAKGAKYVKNGALKPETVTKGIRALAYNDEIEIIPIEESKLLLTAFALRNMLDDFIDCIILATAINNCEALITEDTDIKNLRDNAQFDVLFKTTNSAFKIATLSHILTSQKAKEG
jgi:PIN domain nuclease of toxin-antitoxin system